MSKNYALSLFFGLFLLPFFSTSQAQNIDVGARVGLQWANVSGFDSLDTKAKFNFTFSAYTLIPLGPVKINPEILFEGRGFKYDDPDGFFELKQRIGYFSIPVFVNYYFLEDQMYIQAGPYVSFLTSAELNVSGSLSTLGGDNQDSFNNTDYGLGFGLGFDMGRFDFGFRYMLGLADITSGTNSADNFNRVLNFHVGVKIIKADSD